MGYQPRLAVHMGFTSGFPESVCFSGASQGEYQRAHEGSARCGRERRRPVFSLGCLRRSAGSERRGSRPELGSGEQQRGPEVTDHRSGRLRYGRLGAARVDGEGRRPAGSARLADPRPAAWRAFRPGGAEACRPRCISGRTLKHLSLVRSLADASRPPATSGS